jgi:anti-sigma regulatory factor (Ser/Thr protein kinase)
MSAPQARQFVLAAGWSDDPDLNLRLATIVSEVVTNAILHARTPFVVTVSADEKAIRVDVTDESDALPSKRKYGALHPTGRGLHIVEAIADRWGVAPGPSGKTVWFELEREEAVS